MSNNLILHKTYCHQSLEESEMTLNGILDLIVEGVWDWNGNSGHVTRSPGWYHMLGYQVGTFKEDVFTWENIIHPDDYISVMNHFEGYLQGKIDKYEIEYRCKTGDGTYLWIIDRASIVRYNPDGSVARMIGAHHNIQAQKLAQIELIKQEELRQSGNITLEKIIRQKAEQLEVKNQSLMNKMMEVEFISNTDPLTGIANRKKFEEDLCKEVSRAKRYTHPLSIALFDIDFFKNINDTYGHKFGDNILLILSKLVSKNIRDVDFFSRWGGDEFVIIFPDLTVNNAAIACEKLRLVISQYEIEAGLFITSSFGVTAYQSTDSADDIFQRADKLLYLSKDKGRNKVQSDASSAPSE